MFFNRFQHRSYELENIDKGTYTAEEYDGSLVELRRVNRLLGDASILRRALLAHIPLDSSKPTSILDVGAGSGYLLRVIASWARRNRRSVKLAGIELNERSAQSIVDESKEFPEIKSIRGDGLELPFPTDSFDYAISSLALHHFDDESAVRLLREMSRVARLGIFVIDLHRHPLAYLLYTTAGRLILHNRLLREDGALSILRGFRPAELYQLASKAELDNIRVDRRFPFRLVLQAKKPARFAPSARSGRSLNFKAGIRKTA